uniref:Uncharacterized protein n=1 Tax=Ananas comosus var. bracteatus TaxID=296719 RepID=A0A6V7NL67_ANACO|nr:unnamed protein product [Ananas comosus var. bracteatus]
MSHCGWNSCMESMGAGVPMLTWPMHSDQPRNAQLVARVLGAGWRRGSGRRGRRRRRRRDKDAVVAFMLVTRGPPRGVGRGSSATSSGGRPPRAGAPARISTPSSPISRISNN